MNASRGTDDPPIVGAVSPEIPYRPRVVILGAGFGGLEAAKALADAPVEVTLVDRQNHHCFQPLLYQVATAALSPADIAWPIRAIFRDQANLRAVMASVTGIDRERRHVVTDRIVLPFDHLIIATGATHSYFGHDEWAAVAPGLKRVEDATRIRGRILAAFEKAEVATDPETRRRLTTFVVIGGGPTGVEMAGAIAEVARQTLRRDFRRIDPAVSRIVLVEAGPRLLPALPEDLSTYAEDSLRRMGVEVRTGSAVTACDPHGVVMGGERLDAETLIWAAGVTASPAARWLGAAHDRAGRITVGPDLSVPGMIGVYAIGDTAHLTGQDGKPIPGIAPAAKQMGRHVGRSIAARVAGDTAGASRPFHYRHHGDLATVGRRAAVVRIVRLHLKGFVGWLFWSLAHVWYLIGARNRIVVAFTWLWSYLTFQRGARLINS
ncbi:NAD(P)/FAD-dependent oxidoreductase [Rhodoplanes sp. SY1]|uniref:NAD(P)/FAD-dependent oxidoreductase n=1 Tax=Rhodoplanes sp. SY1 TaxID=3166646 RepID=UPI0038B69A9F